MVRHLFFPVLAISVWVAEGTSKPPHIVAILADDFGWANVGYHREPGFRETATPNIDALVKQGVELDRHYAYPLCSPSRSSFQSGRLAVHVNVENFVEPTVFNPLDRVGGYAGIPLNMTGIAQKMQQGGYRTHMTGKWDCGMATERHTPRGRGYDSFYGYFHHTNDYWTERVNFSANRRVDICGNKFVDLWDNDRPAFRDNSTAYEEELFENVTMKVIKEHNASTPLFLVHAFHIVHNPLQVPSSYLDGFSFIDVPDRRTYAAMVHYMDGVVGRIVAALKLRHMYDSTLLVFMSDNGGPLYNAAGANNYPLKGGKYSNWEGGIRVNAFASGGAIPAAVAGSKLESLTSIADWYTTFASLAGVEATDGEAEAAGLPAVDGIDLWPLLSGKASKLSRDELHISTKAFIRGQFKLIIGQEPMSLWPGPYYPNKTDELNLPSVPGYNETNWFDDCHGGCLFNIFEDPSERHDLAAERPELLASMVLRLVELNRAFYSPDRGNESRLACEVAENKYGGFYGPFLDLGGGAASHVMNKNEIHEASSPHEIIEV